MSAIAVITRQDGTEVLAGHVIDDISTHRVWWRRHWVLWYEDPRTFERARPWSHRVPVLTHVFMAALPVLLLVVALLTGAAPLTFAAVGSGAVAGVWGTLTVLAEARFARWVRGNDSRVFLDVLLTSRRTA